MPALTIARLTLRETARRRLVHAVVALTALIVGLTGWGFSRLNTVSSGGQPLPRFEVMSSAAILVILVAFMFSFVLAVGAAFLAAPAIATDVESGLVLAMLPRPIRRSEFVAGKWLGLAAMLAVFTAIAGALELAVVNLVVGYVPPHPALAIAFLVGQSLILLTLGLLCSTRLSPMTGGIVSLVLFGLAWIMGVAASFGSAFGNTAIVHAGTVVNLIVPTDGLWRGAVFNLEPAAMAAVGSDFSRQNPFSVSAPPTAPLLVWSAAWVLVVLAVAWLRFRSRDL